FIGSFSLAGVPPFNGFASKLIIYEASLEKGVAVGWPMGGIYVLYCILAMFGSAVSLATMMKVMNSAFFGRLPDRLGTVKDVPATMYTPLLALSVACIILGVAPQLAIDHFVGPAAQIVVGGAIQTTIFGVVTSIGFYQATMIATLIFMPLILGVVIYQKVGMWRASTAEPKYGVFVGGEIERPYVDIGEVKADMRSFTFAAAQMFDRYYQFMWRGGLDRIYRRLASCFAAATGHVRRAHIGVINIYSVWVVLGAVILMILAVI
ncbi:hypothetical protein KEJ39_03830, partial [Candidatus Bathyarchaeota archaeon]|nr:hypothetical protein [Candidatus Bathyarchaeota archaeon]